MAQGLGEYSSTWSTLFAANSDILEQCFAPLNSLINDNVLSSVMFKDNEAIKITAKQL